MHVASCACECDIEVKPCMAPIRHALSCFVQICATEIAWAQRHAANPCACAVCQLHTDEAAEHRDASQNFKEKQNKTQRCQKKKNHITTLQQSSTQSCRQDTTVAPNQQRSPTSSHSSTQQQQDLRWENDVTSESRFYLVFCYNSWLHVE